MATAEIWNASEGRNSWTLMIQPWSVSFGGGGPGPYDQGGSTCSHADFQNGHFHSDIERLFDSGVLQSALAVSTEMAADERGSLADPERNQLEAWERVAIDPALTSLAENGDEYGSQRFDLADAAFATTDGHTLSMDRHTATIMDLTGRAVTIAKQLSFVGLLAHNGRFYLAANGQGYVFDTTGRLVTSTEHLVEAMGMSHGVRVDDVIRAGDDIAFAYWSYGDGLDPITKLLGAAGTFRLSDDGVVTARGTHDRKAAVLAARRSRESVQYVRLA